MDFERFLGFFVAAGYDLDARDSKGQSFIDLVAKQRQARPYIELIEAMRG